MAGVRTKDFKEKNCRFGDFVLLFWVFVHAYKLGSGLPERAKLSLTQVT